MAFSIDEKLVVGISSNALFDLQKEDNIFKKEGLEAYREYQVKNRDVILEKGVAFPFIKRFLAINEVYEVEQPVEVILLSRNSPETGIRVFNSIRYYGLNISRAAFMSGGSVIDYIPAFNISLFLTKDESDVKNALESDKPAGRILETEVIDDDNTELRVALMDFFKKLSILQKLEKKKCLGNKSYKKILKTSIITARNAPTHERAINTLNNWGVDVDEMFLLGGIAKSKVLNVMKPHLYLDDQKNHLYDTDIKGIPLVHIPFGITNKVI